MKKIFNDKIIGKVIKTFIEGFIASLVVSLQSGGDFTDTEVIKGVVIGGIAMGLSAVINLLQSKLTKEE